MSPNPFRSAISATAAYTLGVLLLSSHSLAAQTGGTGSGEVRPMTVADVLAMRQVGNVALSPSGRWVAYVVTERDLERNVKSAVYGLI